MKWEWASKGSEVVVRKFTRFGAGLRVLTGFLMAMAIGFPMTSCQNEALLNGEGAYPADTLYVPQASLPSGTYTGPQKVLLTSLDSGVQIRYTLDGTFPVDTSALYTDSLLITKTSQVRVRAFYPGWTPSPDLQLAYRLRDTVQCVISALEPGKYPVGTRLVLTSGTPQAKIVYTLDGSEPNDSSLVYTAPLTLQTSAHVRARALKEDWVPSCVTSYEFVIGDGASADSTAAPEANLAEATYAQVQFLTLKSTTPYAKIYFTLDGSTPTTSSTLYTNALAIQATTTVRAIAIAAGQPQSRELRRTITIQVPEDKDTVQTPVADVAEGTYTEAQVVSLSSLTAGATIHYTRDGSVPTTQSPVYSGALLLRDTTVLRAIAVLPGKVNSPEFVRQYKIAAEGFAAVTFGVTSGTYSNVQSIDVTSNVPGAKVEYTWDKQVWKPLTAAPLTLTTSDTLCVRTIMGDTLYDSSFYILRAATPQFGIASGLYWNPQTVSITSKTADAVIYYTIDGTDPEPNVSKSTYVYSKPIQVSVDGHVRARAVRPGFEPSSIMDLALTFDKIPELPTIGPKVGTFTEPVKIGMSSSEGATIYYTLDGTTPTTYSLKYEDSIWIDRSLMLKAMAVKNGMDSNGYTMAEFVINLPKLLPPTFALRSGVAMYSIFLTNPSENPVKAVLEYSLDKKNWLGYSPNGIVLETSTMLYARTVLEGYESGIDSALVQITAAPVITPVGEGVEFDSQLVVKLAHQTASAVLEYSYDNITWYKYTAAGIPVTKSGVKVYGRATVNGVQGVSYSKYLLRSKLPIVTPGGGTFSAPTTIYVTSGNPDAKFYYTLDHTVPTSSSSVYDPKVGIVVKDPLTTVKVISQVEGFEPSNYVMNDYIVNQQDGVIGSFVDPRDNQSYPMTRITVNGVSQIWMARNLDYTPTTAGGYMCPENRADSCLKYGKLYNWQTAKKGGVAAAGGVRDICPDGWHLPTSVEWANLKTLARELRSTTSWDASNGIITTPTWSGNMNGTDKFGFTALPAGYFSTIFGGTGYQAYWWASDLTTSTTNVGYAMYARSYGYFDYLEIKDNAQYNFMSVRCLKDAN